MDARLNTSLKHKFQAVPRDLLSLIKTTFYEKYDDFLKDKTLIVEGAIYPEELVLLLGLKNNTDKIIQTNFECSMDYVNTENNNVLDKFHVSVDALDSMFSEYIEAKGDIEMPQIWTAFDVDSHKIYMKSSTINTELERLADELLANASSKEQDTTTH